MVQPRMYAHSAGQYEYGAQEPVGGGSWTRGGASPGMRLTPSFAAGADLVNRTSSPMRISPRARSPMTTDAGLQHEITAAVDALVSPVFLLNISNQS